MNERIEPATEVVQVKVTYRHPFAGLVVDGYTLPGDNPNSDAVVRENGVLEVRHAEGITFFAPGVWQIVEGSVLKVGECA